MQVRPAQLQRRRTLVSLLQDGINSLFWMVQHRLTLNGYVLEEIHLGLVIGQISPVSLYPEYKSLSFPLRLRTLISILLSNLSNALLPGPYLFVEISIF